MTKDKRRMGGLVPAHSKALSRSTAEADDSSLFSSLLKASLWGLLIFALCGALLITAVTAVAYANPDPGRVIAPFAILALMPSMFFCGFITAKKVKGVPLLCGLVSGGIVTLVTMIVGIFFRNLPTSAYAFWQSAALHGTAILFSLFGAFAGNVKKRPKIGKRRFGR